MCASVGVNRPASRPIHPNGASTLGVRFDANRHRPVSPYVAIYCGGRHIGHSFGPSGSSISLVTSNPKRK